MAAVGKITHEDIEEFVKFLVEACGIYDVDKDRFIINNHKEQKLLIKIKDEELPVKIYHATREPGTYSVLNPFKETTTLNPVLVWFLDSIEVRMSMTLFSIMTDILKISFDKSPEAQAKLVQLLDIIDIKEVKTEESMIEQINLLEPTDILSIFYQARQKQGQIQSNLDIQETQTRYKKIRKKTWAYINDIFWAIFGCAPNEIHKLFTYTPTTIPAPHCETIITLMYRYYKTLEPICKILGLSYPDIEVFSAHLVCIEKYQRMVTWDDSLINRPQKEITPPWSSKGIDAPAQVKTSVPMPTQTPTTFGSRRSGVPQVVMTSNGMQVVQNSPPVAQTIAPSGTHFGQKFGSTPFVQSGYNRPVGGGGYGGNPYGVRYGGYQPPRYRDGIL